jgi:hypothetical protein
MSARHFLLALTSVLLAVGTAGADYVTPGTGVDWTMDDLVLHSGGVVTGGSGAYDIHQSVVISVTDRLTIAAGAHLTFVDAGGVVGLEVHGSLEGSGTPARCTWSGPVRESTTAISTKTSTRCSTSPPQPAW